MLGSLVPEHVGEKRLAIQRDLEHFCHSKDLLNPSLKGFAGG